MAILYRKLYENTSHFSKFHACGLFCFGVFYLREMSQWHLTSTHAQNTAMLAGEDNLCILLS